MNTEQIFTRHVEVLTFGYQYIHIHLCTMYNEYLQKKLEVLRRNFDIIRVQ